MPTKKAAMKIARKTMVRITDRPANIRSIRATIIRPAALIRLPIIIRPTDRITQHTYPTTNYPSNNYPTYNQPTIPIIRRVATAVTIIATTGSRNDYNGSYNGNSNGGYNGSYNNGSDRYPTYRAVAPQSAAPAPRSNQPVYNQRTERVVLR